MKKALVAFLTLLTPLFSAHSSPVIDYFNTYSNGPLIGQSDWFDRENGSSFIVEDAIANEGGVALFSFNTTPFGIITKTGAKYPNGQQSFFFLPRNSTSWSNLNSFQLGMFQESWDGPSRAVMSFRSNGQAYYIDSRIDKFVPFASFNNDSWNSGEIEWRIIDTSARYRINGGEWTGWIPFIVRPSYSYFDTIGISAINLGSGSVYVDTVGEPIPEPPAALLWMTLLLSVFGIRARNRTN